MKAFKIRIYPNQKQQELINKTLGCSRFIFNQMLSERKTVYEKLKDDKRKLYEYKYKTEKQYKEEFDWLSEIDSMALQQARVDLYNAYSNFFRSLKKLRKGEAIGFPKFKKKKDKTSYRTMTTNNNIKVDFENKKVKLPKLGWINYRDKRKNIEGGIKQATVSKTSTGNYFVSVLFETEIETKTVVVNNIPKDKVIGLDCSMSNFFVDNNGNSPAYKRIFRNSQKELKKFQRRLSKKKLYSKNWYKANHKVNLIHEAITNKRKDFTHKLSTGLVRNYDVIVVEDLNLKAMSQCLNLGKSIMDLGYSEFLRQLEYKCDWNSKLFFKADKWFASSKTCSYCGFKYKDLTLSEREWTCPSCGKVIDRDKNAGLNLRNWGLNILELGQLELKPMEFKTSDLEKSELSLNYEVGSQLALAVGSSLNILDNDM